MDLETTVLNLIYKNLTTSSLILIGIETVLSTSLSSTLEFGEK